MNTQIKLDKACSEYFGITPKWYKQLAAKGITPPPVNGHIDVLEAAKGLLSYYRRSEPLVAARAKLLEIESKRKELKLQKERGELVEADRTLKVFLDVLQIMAARLDVLPVKAAPLVLGCKNIQEIQSVIRGFLDEIRNEISDSQFYARLATNKPSNRNDKASTEILGLDVGGSESDVKP